jgi:hypothetical protein
MPLRSKNQINLTKKVANFIFLCLFIIITNSLFVFVFLTVRHHLFKLLKRSIERKNDKNTTINHRKNYGTRIDLTGLAFKNDFESGEKKKLYSTGVGIQFEVNSNFHF